MIDDDVFDPEAEVEDDASSTYLTLELGGQMLGIEVRHVREILDRRRITRLPNAPPSVEGVVDVRGQSVPILDLKGRLGMLTHDDETEQRIVVIEIGARREPIGILADRVRNVEVIPPAEVERIPTAGLDGWDARMLIGLCRRGDDLIVLVDVARIFGAAAQEIDLSAGMGFF